MEANFDTAAFDTTGAPVIRLRDDHKIAFDTTGTRGLRWEMGALRYSVGGCELFNIGDDGRVSLVGVINIPDQSAPTSTADPRGKLGDEIRSGQFFYRKTTSGWYRTQLSAF